MTSFSMERKFYNLSKVEAKSARFYLRDEKQDIWAKKLNQVQEDFSRNLF